MRNTPQDAYPNDNKVAPASHDENVPHLQGEKNEFDVHIVEASTSVGDKELEDAKRYIAEEHEFTDEEYRKLRRKIDLILLPVLMFTYGMQYTDKTSLAQGVVFGLREETGLVGNEYANLSTFFYVAYAVAQFPMSWAMQRFPIGKALSICVIVWGAMVMLLGACNNYAQLAGVRVLLGIFESVITPGYALIVASWYLRSEQTLRQCLYYAMNTFFNIIASILVYLLAKRAEEDGKISAWRVINLFLGAVTIVVGIWNLLILGTPGEVFWLSKREKEMAHARIVSNATGGGEQHPWKWSQVRECLRDPQYWFFFFYNIAVTIPNGAITTFNTLIYRSMGFSSLEVIIYSMPTLAVGFVFVIGPALITAKWPKARFYTAIVTLLVCVVSLMYTGLAPVDTPQWTKYGVFTLSGIYAGAMFIIWPLMTVNVAGRTKKAWLSATSLITYCVGNILGSQAFRPNDAPRYVRGLTACAVVMIFGCVLLLCWRFYYVWENKRRDRAFAESGLTVEEQEFQKRLAGETDMTDFQNVHFRYTY